MPASTAAGANGAHRVIVDHWLRRAIDGMRSMHLNDGERRRIAKQIF
ncbi:hypothetical protein HT746_07000 [Burkholderia pyrrocinia]|nr:hypothetical protein [Burkholderia pyrrocinia]NTX26882.1 hypothetical protein [Burkholderia pyrrocinia]QVN23626.1 hypothetical protein JYG32_34810 [Burkholderia pyrrocinia]